MPQVLHTGHEVFSDLPDGLPFDLAVVVDTMFPFLSVSICRPWTCHFWAGLISSLAVARIFLILRMTASGVIQIGGLWLSCKP
jgi:hypothetical protein